jgi:hypothetical protein
MNSRRLMPSPSRGRGPIRNIQTIARRAPAVCAPAWLGRGARPGLHLATGAAIGKRALPQDGSTSL